MWLFIEGDDLYVVNVFYMDGDMVWCLNDVICVVVFG